MKNFTKAITIAIITIGIVFSVTYIGAEAQKDLDKQYNIYERIQKFDKK